MLFAPFFFFTVVEINLSKNSRWLPPYHEENHFCSSRDKHQCQRLPGMEPECGQEAALVQEVSSEQRPQPHRSHPPP